MHFVKAKGLLSSNNGINIYRGCLHGCIYCDSRSKCYQMNHEFTDIEVKINAVELLDEALLKKKDKVMISTGAMTDPYIPIERDLLLTRKCLETILKYKMGLAIQTKSNLILRDLDLLKEINKTARAVVEMTLTTYDENLCKILEPNVCTTYERFLVLKRMHEEGIETVVWLSPFLPFINDSLENIKGLLNYCKEAKVKAIIYFGVGLTLREGNREYFYEQLDKHFPHLKERYIQTYGIRYSVNSSKSNEISEYVFKFCKENNILCGVDEVFDYLKKLEINPGYKQLKLF